MNTRAVLLVTTGLLIGWLGSGKPVAHAEPHRSAPRQAFTSGAMRSEQILREIASTLRSIDARLARVETTVARIRTDAASGARQEGGRHVRFQ